MKYGRSHYFRAILTADAVGAAILLIVGFSCGFAINQLRNDPLPFFCSSKELRVKLEEGQIAGSSQSQEISQEESDSVAAIVTTKQVEQFLKARHGFVFDARPDIFYRLGHIPDAKSFPRQDFGRAYSFYKTQLEADKTQQIIVYCSNSSCEDSMLVQKALQRLGYVNVAVYRGGWAEWQEK